ncbi:hypothetical protein [Cyanobium sp. T1G-Tous]|uniref:hypothetical protein n=1 Tax=Cyanobium sp. T1G-Tous TaxID=2823722 RepID=UPI0020CC9A92|nr:hypothetical protein [Cyanobium sp. T1G-Tous]
MTAVLRRERQTNVRRSRPASDDNAPINCQSESCLPVTTERKLLRELVAIALSLLMLLTAPSAHASTTTAQHFLCEGDSLEAIAFNGAVDAVGIPNSNADTVPGAFMVLRWRELSLQLPRTNNAGIPSYSDGRWWWQALDPDHPQFAQLRGNAEHYSCEREQ